MRSPWQDTLCYNARMFVNIMRSNQRWLMAVVSVLIAISFLWFYSDRTHPEREVSDKLGTIYGRTLTNTETNRVWRQIQTAAELGLTNVIDRDLLGQGDVADRVVNHLVVAHQAEQMGLYPTDEEVAAAVAKLPVFQSAGGQFDYQKFDSYLADNLAPRGFSRDQLEEIVRRDIQFGKVHAIVDAPVVVSPLEARVAYDARYAKTNASVLRLASGDFTAGIAEPTEDDLKKYYADQKTQYVQPESRRVQYVKWLLTDEQKKLPPPDKNAALKTLGDQSVALLTELLDNKGKEDFAAAAAKLNLTVKETPDFEQGQTAGLEEATIPGFVEAAFKLAKDDPDSDVPLQTPDGFYDLHLAALTPVRPQTLEEARPKLVKAIKDERTRAAMNAKAEEIRTKVADALKGGKSFADAAKEAGQTAQDLPAYSQAEPARTVPDASLIEGTTQELGVGELSKFVATDTGGVFVYVRSREGVDPARFDQQKEMVAGRLSRQKASFYFAQWLQASRAAANVDIIPRHARG